MIEYSSKLEFIQEEYIINISQIVSYHAPSGKLTLVGGVTLNVGDEESKKKIMSLTELV